MWDIKLVVTQCFFLYILAHYIAIAPVINGIVEKLHSKFNKKIIYIFGLIISSFILFGGLFIISQAYENTYFWYGITLITILSSGCIILEIDNYPNLIETPSTLEDYITNARWEIVNGKIIKLLSKFKIVIYSIYIVITILNQVGNLGDNIFSHSMYLQLNEYSLIILFAFCEVVKIFKR